MDKQTELKQSKNKALLLLLAATGIFVVTAFMPKGVWVNGLKAVSEAAMVGALADWFAVVALFKKVPIPFISAHTAIIPNNKDKIADNLAVFVKEKFLDASSIVELIRKHDPAEKVGQWLTAPANTDLLGGYVVKLVAGMLDFTDDARIQAFIKNAFHAVLAKVDLSKSVASVLDTLTKDGRHQELLDAAIVQLVSLLRTPGSRLFIAGQIVEWLKRDHPLKEKLLPTEWLGEHGAEAIANSLDRALVQVGEDPTHRLRTSFDDAVLRLVARLRADPAFLEKGEEIKRYLRDDETINLYIRDLWGQLRAWLKNDVESAESTLHQKAQAMGAWVGRELAHNADLRRSLNEHMEDAARAMAPDFAQFLTRHISDTVKNWDPAEMSWQIELNIGKDLQYIRINGTLVGGAIGLLLYASSLLIEAARTWAVG